MRWPLQQDRGVASGNHGEAPKGLEPLNKGIAPREGSVGVNQVEGVQAGRDGGEQKRKGSESAGTNSKGKIILSSPDVLDQELRYAECGVLGKAFTPGVERQAVADGILTAREEAPRPIDVHVGQIPSDHGN